MRAVIMTEAGGPEVLRVEDIETPTPAEDEVLVKVHAAGVNGPDLVQRRGHYPPPPGASPHLGLEVSGTVVTSAGNWSEGDEVTALTNGGGYAEYVAIRADHCMPVPEGVSLTDAAGLPETYMTVWSNIFTHAPKGRLLVHGGAGGIGSTAIQLAQALGMEAFATEGADKLDFVRDLGATAIDYAVEDFVEILREAGGADVILDIIGGEYIAKNIKAASPDARIVQLAFNKGSKVEINLMPVMLKRLMLTGSTLRSRPDAFKAEMAAQLTAMVWPMFGTGKLRTVTQEVLPLEEAAEAHRRMEAGTVSGKLLLSVT